ncbi:hypothetical protein ONA70_18670 [Micromonospora yasonensis]|uniref:hypothetical protein n=1 Tax=Micromonospora yasonensis TaxID=1128667 RepID=UPI00222F29ED|nr:hypothetical protein [Micromonospora yasonensis]MCW3842126.1 hypothetical protein [Micromonospora yasonensis]
MLTVVTQSASTPADPDVAQAPTATDGSLIDEIVRDGAHVDVFEHGPGYRYRVNLVYVP